jgi:hypothetical protein
MVCHQESTSKEESMTPTDYGDIKQLRHEWQAVVNPPAPGYVLVVMARGRRHKALHVPLAWMNSMDRWMEITGKLDGALETG